MKIDDWLQQAQTKLSQAGIGTARLDSLILLKDRLNKNRTQILAYPDLLLQPKQQKWLDERIALRASHQPLAYIRGKSEFFRRNFFVDQEYS